MTQSHPGGAGPTSVRSPRVSAVRALHRSASRQERRLFVAEGPQSVREALASPGVVQELYATAAAVAAHREFGAAVIVPDEVLAAMAETRAPQGVVAVCRFIDVPLAEAVHEDAALVAALWQIRDPGNAGTVLRSADAAGASAVLFSADSVDVYNGKCVRSTAGSLFHIPVVVEVDVIASIDMLRARGFTVLAADGQGTAQLYDLLPSAQRPGALSGRVAWVFGNEARGLDPLIAAAVDLTVSIPIDGRAESLNLAAAASMCLLTTVAAQRGRVASPG